MNYNYHDYNYNSTRKYSSYQLSHHQVSVLITSKIVTIKSHLMQLLKTVSSHSNCLATTLKNLQAMLPLVDTLPVKTLL